MGDPNLELYRRLLLIRRAEEFIIEHYAANEMKTPMHMSMGEEAIPVGVVDAIGQGGKVLASYRSHGAYIAKANEVNTFFAELYGRVTGTAGGKAGSMHLAHPAKGHLGSSAVVGTPVPLAVGAAFSEKQRNTGNVVAVFFGEGAMDEGVFWESLNAACVMKLPVIFVCEDNGLAVHTRPNTRQGYTSIPNVVSGFSCHLASSDTTDAGEVSRITRDAITAMRSSAQPAFLHFRYYRYLEHVGVGRDFKDGYRSEEEMKPWLERDPLNVMRARLLAGGHGEQELVEFEGAIAAEVEKSTKAARTAPSPAVEGLYTSIFS